MKTRKIITLLLLSIVTLAHGQKTSKEEIAKIVKEQSVGVYKGTEAATKTVYSDGKEVVSTVYKDVKSLTPKIAQGINEIAKGLKIGAESVWLILVKQQKVWSICFLILTIASLINWLLFYKRNIKQICSDKIGTRTVKKYIDNPDFDENYYIQYKKYLTSTYSSDKEKTEVLAFKKKILIEEKEDFIIPIEYNEKMPFFRYIHLFSCVILSGFSFFHFGDMLTGFLNPEYGAMKDILFVALKLK